MFFEGPKNLFNEWKWNTFHEETQCTLQWPWSRRSTSVGGDFVKQYKRLADCEKHISATFFPEGGIDCLPGLGRQCARGGRGLSLPTSPINTRSFTCRHLEAERHGGNLVVLVSNQKTTFGSPLHLPVLNLFWLNLVRRERRGNCRRDKKNGGESLGWAEQRWLDVGEQAWDAVWSIRQLL